MVMRKLPSLSEIRKVNQSDRSNQYQTGRESGGLNTSLTRPPGEEEILFTSVPSYQHKPTEGEQIEWLANNQFGDASSYPDVGAAPRQQWKTHWNQTQNPQTQFSGSEWDVDPNMPPTHLLAPEKTFSLFNGAINTGTASLPGLANDRLTVSESQPWQRFVIDPMEEGKERVVPLFDSAMKSIVVPDRNDPTNEAGKQVALYQTQRQEDSTLPTASLVAARNYAILNGGDNDRLVGQNLFTPDQARAKIQSHNNSASGRAGRVIYRNVGTHDWNAIGPIVQTRYEATPIENLLSMKGDRGASQSSLPLDLSYLKEDNEPVVTSHTLPAQKNPLGVYIDKFPTANTSDYKAAKAKYNQSLKQGTWIREGDHQADDWSEFVKAQDYVKGAGKKFKGNSETLQFTTSKGKSQFDPSVPLANPETSTSISLAGLQGLAKVQGVELGSTYPQDATEAQKAAYLLQNVKLSDPQTMGYKDDPDYFDQWEITSGRNPNPIVAHGLSFDAKNRRHLPADGSGVADDVVYPGLREGLFERNYVMNTSKGINAGLAKAFKAGDEGALDTSSYGRPGGYREATQNLKDKWAAKTPEERIETQKKFHVFTNPVTDELTGIAYKYEQGDPLVARVKDDRHEAIESGSGKTFRPTSAYLQALESNKHIQKFGETGRGYIPTVTGDEQFMAKSPTVFVTSIRDGERIATKRAPSIGNHLTPLGVDHLQNLVASATGSGVEGKVRTLLNSKDPLALAKLNASPRYGLSAYPTSGMQDLRSTLVDIYRKQNEGGGIQDVANSMLSAGNIDTLVDNELNNPIAISGGFDSFGRPIAAPDGGFNLSATSGKYDNLPFGVQSLLDLDEKYPELNRTKGSRSQLTREQSGVIDGERNIGRQYTQDELGRLSSAHWSENLPVATTGDLRNVPGISNLETAKRNIQRLDPSLVSQEIQKNDRLGRQYVEAVAQQKADARSQLGLDVEADTNATGDLGYWSDLDREVMGPGYPESNYTQDSVTPTSATMEALKNIQSINRGAANTDNRIVAQLNPQSDVALNQGVAGIQKMGQAEHVIRTAKALGWQPVNGDPVIQAQHFLKNRPTQDLSAVFTHRDAMKAKMTQRQQAEQLIRSAFPKVSDRRAWNRYSQQNKIDPEQLSTIINSWGSV